MPIRIKTELNTLGTGISSKANICQYEKKLKRKFDSDRIMYLFCIKWNICEFVRIFCSEYKQIMPINGVCEYTETCEYEANKIHIHLIRFKANKKVTKIAPPRKYVRTYYVYHGCWW